MSTPSVTPAQIVAAILAAIVPLLTLVGVDLTSVQLDALAELRGIALALIGADAAIRIGRAFNLNGVLKAKALHAAAHASTPPTDERVRESGVTNIACMVVIAVAVGMVIVGTWATVAHSAEPDLSNGRTHVVVGRPLATPAQTVRRVWPAGSGQSARYVTLRVGRASLPRTWEAWELEQLRGWAKRAHWRTAAGKGFDLTPGVTGKEWRVDRRILSGVNATARAGASRCDVISGWRDSSLQTRLWQLFLAGLGNPANPPGTSKHEARDGLPATAADTYCNGIAFWTWAKGAGVQSYAKARGLTNPYAHEPWHVEYSTPLGVTG